MEAQRFEDKEYNGILFEGRRIWLSYNQKFYICKEKSFSLQYDVLWDKFFNEAEREKILEGL